MATAADQAALFAKLDELGVVRKMVSRARKH